MDTHVFVVAVIAVVAIMTLAIVQFPTQQFSGQAPTVFQPVEKTVDFQTDTLITDTCGNGVCDQASQRVYGHTATSMLYHSFYIDEFLSPTSARVRVKTPEGDTDYVIIDQDQEVSQGLVALTGTEFFTVDEPGSCQVAQEGYAVLEAGYETTEAIELGDSMSYFGLPEDVDEAYWTWDVDIQPDTLRLGAVLNQNLDGGGDGALHEGDSLPFPGDVYELRFDGITEPPTGLFRASFDTADLEYLGTQPVLVLESLSPDLPWTKFYFLGTGISSRAVYVDRYGLFYYADQFGSIKRVEGATEATIMTQDTNYSISFVNQTNATLILHDPVADENLQIRVNIPGGYLGNLEGVPELYELIASIYPIGTTLLNQRMQSGTVILTPHANSVSDVVEFELPESRIHAKLSLLGKKGWGTPYGEPIREKITGSFPLGAYVNEEGNVFANPISGSDFPSLANAQIELGLFRVVYSLLPYEGDEDEGDNVYITYSYQGPVLTTYWYTYMGDSSQISKDDPADMEGFLGSRDLEIVYSEYDYVVINSFGLKDVFKEGTTRTVEGRQLRLERVGDTSVFVSVDGSGRVIQEGEYEEYPEAGDFKVGVPIIQPFAYENCILDQAQSSLLLGVYETADTCSQDCSTASAK